MHVTTLPPQIHWHDPANQRLVALKLNNREREVFLRREGKAKEKKDKIKSEYILTLCFSSEAR